jgi:hypothetical protein
MTLLDGKQTAQFIKDEIRTELELISLKGFRKPQNICRQQRKEQHSFRF